MRTQNTANAPSGQKGSQTVIIIGIVVIAALLGVIIFLLLGRDSGQVAEEEPKRNVVVNQDNIEEVIRDMTEEQLTAPGYYEVKMNSTWKFEDGASPSSNAYVENVANNTNDVYFDLQLADTGEVILESPLIPIGSHMRNITLDTDLDAGTYDCVLVYHLVDEEQNTLSTLSMSVTVEIAN